MRWKLWLQAMLAVGLWCLSPLSAQERVVLLLDRSGSMAGAGIESTTLTEFDVRNRCFVGTVESIPAAPTVTDARTHGRIIFAFRVTLPPAYQVRGYDNGNRRRFPRKKK